MARIARDSTPKRRSARLSNNQASTRKTPVSTLQLDSVLERDETPDVDQPSIDHVIATPSTSLQQRLTALSNVTTPKTETQPANDQMHPATVHQTTAKAPDSGLKLGFADISTTGRASIASLQNTPSRPRQSLARTNISPSFQFKFSHENNMTDQGRQLMDSIRGDAARIKEQMRAEKEAQEQTGSEGDDVFVDATGRKIAKPQAKAGRFSDVHMAQFKKMDSIANHPSSFRAKQSFARPTAQSLKRSSSKANLDDSERPRTAGKSPVTRIPPPVTGRPTSLSPFKSINTGTQESEAATKRLRLADDQDVSTSKPTTLPRPVSSRLLSPTKASTARITDNASSTPAKPSALPRSNSVRSIHSVSRPSTAAGTLSASKLPQAQLNKPLPPVPAEQPSVPSSAQREIRRPNSTKSLAIVPSPIRDASSSRIPMFANLKSILRSPKKNSNAPVATTPKHITLAAPLPASSPKKVDFTPSVKSRYAVKLAEASPSPAKLDRANRISDKWQPAIPYDSSAFIVNNDMDWESEDDSTEEQVTYPSLPTLSPRSTSRVGTSTIPLAGSGPVDHTFARKAREHGRRESTEFKSIFTTLHPKPEPTTTSLTAVNTNVNRTNPIVNASRVVSTSNVLSSSTSPRKSVASPSSIRKVRTSEPAPQVQPFEDRTQTVPHGIPGKKRRHESEKDADQFGNDEDAKENRALSPQKKAVPGAWEDSVVDRSDDEGEKRGGKRVRVDAPRTSLTRSKSSENKEWATSPAKKAGAKPTAREVAAKSARDRKSKASIGGISLSRLNALSSPKKRA